MKQKIKLLMSLALVVVFSIVTPKAKADAYLSDKTETVYDNSTGLITGKANSICQTNDGYIWIGQYRGLVKYNSHSFELIESEKYNLTNVTSLDSYQNTLYIGTQQGLFSYLDGEIKEYKLASSFSVDNIKVFNDLCFISTNFGLYKLDIKTDSYSKISEKVNDFSYSDNKLYSIIDKSLYLNNKIVEEFKDINVTSVSYDGTLLVGDESGIYINTKNNYVSLDESYLKVNSYLKKENNYYLGTDTGLFKLDIENSKLEEEFGLSINSSIEKIIFDFESNLWLCSSKKGVCKITLNQVTNIFVKYSLANASVNAFTIYKGKYYIGSDIGITIINPNDPVNIYDFSLLNISSRIRAITEFNDKLYIATYNHKDYDLIEYDGTGQSGINNIDLAAYTNSASNASDIRCLYATSKNLYIGTKKEIIRFDGTNYYTLKLENSPLNINYNDNKLYVVLEDLGVITLAEDFNSTSQFNKIEESSYPALKTLFVNNRLFYNKSNLLYYLENNTPRLINYKFEGSIVEMFYKHNEYYIATDTKIYVFDDIYEGKPKKIIGLTEGIKGPLTSNGNGYYDATTDSYFFVSSLGVYQYFFNTKAQKYISPKVNVSKIIVNGTNIGSINNTYIPKTTERITFQFDILTYRINPDYTVYFKLDGVDNDYRLLDQNDSLEVSYTNLAGGNYNFHIYVLDNGIKSNEVSIQFEKARRYFEIPGFWIVITIFVILMLVFTNFFYIRHRVRKTIERQNEYKAITLESIEAIARTIDAKDHYTNGHSLRVGFYSREIAKALGLSSDEVENICYAGLLHDIGKIAVPDNILNKPGHLTDNEFNIIKSHTVEGSEILSSISTIPNITLGAKYHHERYDGTGYPEKLKGEEIPLVARIICCADCYDAMATQRVYKEPYLTDHIINEFNRCKGTQFDPKIVNIVIKLIKEGKISPNIDTNISQIKNMNK